MSLGVVVVVRPNHGLVSALNQALVSFGCEVRTCHPLKADASQLSGASAVVVLLDENFEPGAPLPAWLVASSAALILVADGDPMRWTDRAAELGAMALLTTPLDLTLLLASLRLWLAHHRERTASRVEKSGLRDAVLNSRRISAAVGILAERHGISLEQAFDILRSSARANRERIDAAALMVTPRTAQNPSVTAPASPTESCGSEVPPSFTRRGCLAG